MAILQKLIEKNIEHIVLKCNTSVGEIKGPREFIVVTCTFKHKRILRQLGFVACESGPTKFLMLRKMSTADIRQFNEMYRNKLYSKTISNNDGSVFNRIGRDFKTFYSKHYFDMYDETFITRKHEFI